MDISVLVPLYNEAESLPSLHEWIVRVMKAHAFTYEIIFVNDGSTDSSWQVIQSLRKEDNNVRGICFRRNYGKSAALHCGFKAVKGDVVITQPVKHRAETVFLVHHGNVQVVHVHDVHDILHGRAVGGVAHALYGQDVAEGVLSKAHARLSLVRMDGPRGFAQQVLILLKVGQVGNEVMPHAARLLTLHGQIKGRKAVTDGHAEVVRHQLVVLKLRKVDHGHAHLTLHGAGDVALALHEPRQIFVLKRAQLNADHGTLLIFAARGGPKPGQLLIALGCNQLHLLLGQFAQNRAVFLRDGHGLSSVYLNHVFTKNLKIVQYHR